MSSAAGVVAAGRRPLGLEDSRGPQGQAAPAIPAATGAALGAPAAG